MFRITTTSETTYDQIFFKEFNTKEEAEKAMKEHDGSFDDPYADMFIEEF